MQYSKAKKLADRLVELLTPYCDIIHIAGSIRRAKPECGDMEIVCLPKKVFVTTDLFNEQKKVDPQFTKTLYACCINIISGTTTGRHVKAILIGGMKLDLFLPQPHDYYRQLAIRTGSAEFSHLVLAGTWKQKGWVGTHDGLRKQNECVRLGDKWACIVKDPVLPPAWNSEEEFFQWLELPWTEPQLRDQKKLINQYQ